MGNGTRLQEILKKKRYTVAQLAAETEISVNTLYAIIKRDSDIKSSNLTKIAEALGYTTDELTSLLSEEKKEEPIEQHVLDPENILSDLQAILKKINSLSREYAYKLEQSEKVRKHIAKLEYTKAQIVDDISESQSQLKLLENDIDNMSIELDLLRNQLKGQL